MNIQSRTQRARHDEESVFAKCDICIYATGYTRPSLDFLQNFSNGYDPPNWFLQVFPPGSPTICAINSTWIHGVGSVGGSHIGMYTRLLLVYTLDVVARPPKGAMSRWVNIIDKIWKPTHGLACVTTGEVYLWFVLVIAFNPALWKWGQFIMFGDECVLDRWKMANSIGTSSRYK